MEIGSTIRSIAEMHRMVIEELRTSSAAMHVSSRAVAEEQAVVGAPVVRVELAELAVRVVREALAVLAELVVQGDREAPVELEELVSQVVRVGPAASAELVSQAAPVELVARAVLAVPAIVPAVALVLEIDQVEEQVPVIVPVEAREQETVQVAAVPELDPVVGRRKIK